MLKRIQSILFVVCIVMVFTAQTKRPDEKGRQHAPAARPAVHNNQARPQVQNRPVIGRSLPRVKVNIPKPLDERRGQRPRVYAVRTPAPAANNRLFHRQHHNHWQPRYNFYNNQYHFYPYVNIASTVELSADYASVGLEGQAYFYDEGTFYQQDAQGQYVAVAPPIGIIVSAIPSQARQINVNGQIYYRYKGVFYIQVAQGYQVVGPLQPDNS